MIYVKESKFVGTTSGGKALHWIYLEADELADLPAPDVYASDGLEICMGSEAHVIDDNSKHMLKSDGTWVQQVAGTATYTKAEVDALIASVDTLKQGTEIPADADLNDYTDAGTYYSPNSTRTGTLYNRPWSGSGFKMIVYSISTTSKMQWIMPMSNTAHSVFIRSRTTSGWRDWYELEGALISTINPYP